MKKIYKYILTILIIFLPSYASAADLDITCYQGDTKPSIVAPTKLFDISNFVPGETSIRTMKVVNNASDGNCSISFKGEGSTNSLTDKINIAFSDVYGNIVDNQATSNKNLSDFLESDRILLADVAPGDTIERNLILTFNTEADNSLQAKNTNFDIRIISEWGVAPTTVDTDNQGDVQGTSTIISSRTTKDTQIEALGAGGPDETVEDVKGVEECKADIKLYGYVYIDQNKNSKKDEKEKVLPNIPIKIYIKEDGKQKTIKDLTTNNEGYWEIMLCNGTYYIEIDRNSLPENTDVTNNISEVVLGSNIEKYSLDIPVNDTRNIWEKYWPFIILAILLILLIIYLLLKNRKKKKPLPK